MKKYLFSVLSFSVSFIAAIFAFFLALAVFFGAGNPTLGLPPILLIGSDRTVNIFGNALVIPGQVIGVILSYPKAAFDFMLSFFPKTLRCGIVFSAEQIFSHFPDFLYFLSDSVKGFFAAIL